MNSDKASIGRAARHGVRWRALWGGASLYAAVIAGGILGSLARWLAALALPPSPGALPWATLLANAIGCLVIGFYAELTGPGGRLFAGPRTRQFVMTGICGGYTTFSGFALEAVGFLRENDMRMAALYLALSVTTWLLAVWAGEALAGRIND